MAKPNLVSALAKLDGAENRLNELKSVVRDFPSVGELLTIRAERDGESGVRVFAEDVGDIPHEWSVWIGEIVHDMRSALDHIAFGLNVLGAGVDPPPNERFSQFPLYTGNSVRQGGDRFDSMCRKSADDCPIGSVIQEAVAQMELLQPYHRWDDPDPDWDCMRLWELVELSNIDKHRGFPVAVATTQMLGFPSDVEGHKTGVVSWFYGPLKPGTEIMMLDVPTLPPERKHPKVEFPFACAIEFDWMETNAGVPRLIPHDEVPFALNQILDVIRRRVVPAFEPFFL